MAIDYTVSQVLHLAFAGIWTGSVVFATWAVLPTARDGDVDPSPLERIVGKLTTVSRVSSVVLLLTGGHMAGTTYEVAGLTGTTSGHLVLAMVALWLVLTALVEVGAAKMRDGLDDRKVRTPEDDARPYFYAASVVAVLLLVDAGLLAAGGL